VLAQFGDQTEKTERIHTLAIRNSHPGSAVVGGPPAAMAATELPRKKITGAQFCRAGFFSFLFFVIKVIYCAVGFFYFFASATT